MARHSTQTAVAAILILISGLICVPGANALVPASMSGMVRDSHGTPQAGALVEVRAGDPAYPSYKATAYTDRTGHYQFKGLPTGRYRVQAMAAMYLTALRDNLHLRPGQSTVLDLTLSTLFEVQLMIPAQRRAAQEPRDNWKWTLRSAANRPVLRLLEDGSLATVQGDPELMEESASSAQGRSGVFALNSGSDELGKGGVRATGLMQGELRDGQSWMMRMDSATDQPKNGGYAAGLMRRLSPASEVGMTVTYRQMPVGTDSLQSVVMRGAQSVKFGDLLDTQIGNETEVVRISGPQMAGGGTATAMHPFARVRWHGDGPISVEYALSTAMDMQRTDDLDNDSALQDVALNASRLVLENAMHQELFLERDLGSTLLRAGYFIDRISNPVLQGGGWYGAAQGDPVNAVVDSATGVFHATGPGYSGDGFLIQAKQHWKGDTWASFEYANGPALIMPDSHAGNIAMSVQDAVATIRPRRSSEAAVTLQGRLAHSGTQWRSAYRWQGRNTMTAVDPFHANGSDPYLSVFVRQRLPDTWVLPNGVEIVLDVRNLLAEGYHPVVLNNGQTVYFAQRARSVRGGVEFNF